MRNKNNLRLFMTLLLFWIACSTNSKIRMINGDYIDSKEVDHIVMSLMDSAHVTGLCLAVINDNELAYVKAYGYKNKEKNEFLNENTVILGASFSKVIFSYIVLQLVQENVLELDKPLYQYLDKPLPEYDGYTDLDGDDRWKLITARICMSHSTGFPNLRFINPRGNGKLEIFFDPGSKYAYSGEGIKLLQFVVEHITKKGLEELAQQRVFGPLGMHKTSFIWQEKFENDYALGHDIIESPLDYKRMTSADGSGSLLTTISDYAKFIKAVAQGRGMEKPMRQAMLSPSVEIHSLRQFPTLTNDATHKYDSIQLSYGLGWGLFTCPFGKAFFKEGHGNGWQNYNVNFIDQKTSIILMTNSDNGEKIFKDVLEKVVGDTFSPWEWEGYVPYSLVKPRPIGVYLYDIITLEDFEKAAEKYKRIKNSRLKDSFLFDEGQLNDLGCQMIRENKIKNAIALFKLNVEEYPGSSNTYFNLGEAYRLIGQIDSAIESYQKSLEIDPRNSSAREKLKELK